MNTHQKVQEYIEGWKLCGYSEDIPDEVPDKLMQLQLAPSYKAICIAILKNDVALKSLGFTPKHTEWYSVLKKEEIKLRNNGIGHSLNLFDI